MYNSQINNRVKEARNNQQQMQSFLTFLSGTNAFKDTRLKAHMRMSPIKVQNNKDVSSIIDKSQFPIQPS